MLNTQNWLSLIEYSASYRVSLSTLRRRIKAGEVEFKLIEGKYLLKNSPLPGLAAPAAGMSQAGSETIAPPTQVCSQSQPSTSLTIAPAPVATEPVVPVAQLLAELKKAFTQTLATKDEHILLLKDEVADLKMLVKVLEDENQRLRLTQPSLSFDLGLEA